MLKKQFVIEWILRERPTGEMQGAIEQAVAAYDQIAENFKPVKTETKSNPDDYITAKGDKLSGLELDWFNEIWSVWGNKHGGKKETADAFKKQNCDVEKARLIFKAAKHHAEHERPVLVRANQTPPYFPKWCNSGRWEEVNQQTGMLEIDSKDPAKEEEMELRREIREKHQEVFSLEKGLIPVGDHILIPKKERLAILRGQLEQIKREQRSNKDGTSN